MMFIDSPMLRALYSLPILFIVFLSWTIVFFFYKGYIFLVQCTLLNSIVYISFHTSLFLMYWSYYKAITTDPGTIPPNFKITSSSSSLEENDRIKEEQYCGKCEMERPSRCHHCHICNRCILKMDYHCPFIGNCVGFFNIRYVCQFMVYASICSIFVGSCCGHLFVVNEGEASIFTMCGMLSGLGLSAALPALAAFDCWLIVNNRSVMELQENTFDNKYDLGDGKKNIWQVCGKSILGYILPINTKYEGDGINYEISVNYCQEELKETEKASEEI
ncbi:unnamed protein product [Blepharisma stoltei]|uniref:Palmitoyltransferase n=1 Tax=Blepharisma stoltei TaxID=1481888 RepID=A0AAU9JR01_9CILI|nr:unnamed protein product [Blepharisma stoltei]